jgi:isopentenyldiphosphate isomerase
MSERAGEEFVEWVDGDDQLIDRVPRSTMRAQNLLHRSISVIVTTSDGRLVVQRRSESKDVYPGWWDIGAGGVLTAGEEPQIGARRELYEELGVNAEPAFVGVERHDDDHIREICRVFRVVHDGPFRPVDGEAAEIRVVDHDEFDELLRHQPFLPGSLAIMLPHLAGFRTARTMSPVQRVEFTIEPFVEAQPGRHVTAPVDALAEMGVEVDVGPFGSACEVGDDLAGDVVATVVREAIGNGATHINVDINRVDGTGGDPGQTP